MRLFIVRHGETVWNAEGRFQGQIDTELNENGIRQAELVAKHLQGHPFEAIISTPLSRAHVTARRIADACANSEVRIVPEFTEINHGDWEGLLVDEVRVRWPGMLDIWHSTPHVLTMPGSGGESLDMLQKRVIPVADSIVEQYCGDVCLVCHDAVIKVLLCYWLDAPLSSFWRFQVGNCSLSVIDLKKKEAPRVPFFGDISFLGNSFESPEQKGL